MSDERVRLFVALTLPEAVRSALVGWRSQSVPRASGLRLIEPGNLHVTLCFLGWQPVGEVDPLWESCRALAGTPAAELRLGDAVWLPPRRPRVLAVELEDHAGALARAQSRLSKALQTGGWYTPEERAFRSHVTVARLGKGARPPVRELPAPQALTFPGSTVTLYRSRLSPSGARYEPLAELELG